MAKKKKVVIEWWAIEHKTKHILAKDRDLNRLEKRLKTRGVNLTNILFHQQLAKGTWILKVSLMGKVARD